MVVVVVAGAAVEVGDEVAVAEVPAEGADVVGGTVVATGELAGFAVTTTDQVPHGPVSLLPRTCPAAVSSRKKYRAFPP
jgi:hypothetical protein